MPRLDRLSSAARGNRLTFPRGVHDGAPLTPLRRPLGACRPAIATTAGLHRRLAATATEDPR
jgi:hypothetical protein